MHIVQCGDLECVLQTSLSEIDDIPHRQGRILPGCSRPRTRRVPHMALRLYGVTEIMSLRDICDIRQVVRVGKSYWQVNLHLGLFYRPQVKIAWGFANAYTNLYKAHMHIIRSNGNIIVVVITSTMADVIVSYGCC